MFNAALRSNAHQSELLQDAKFRLDRVDVNVVDCNVLVDGLELACARGPVQPQLLLFHPGFLLDLFGAQLDRVHALCLVDVGVGQEFSEVHICHWLVTAQHRLARVALNVLIVGEIAHIATVFLLLPILLLLEPLVALLQKIALDILVVLRLFLFLRGRQVVQGIGLDLPALEVARLLGLVLAGGIVQLASLANRLLRAMGSDFNLLHGQVGVRLRVVHEFSSPSARRNAGSLQISRLGRLIHHGDLFLQVFHLHLVLFRHLRPVHFLHVLAVV